MRKKETEQRVKKTNMPVIYFRRFCKNKAAVAGLAVFAALILLAVSAPVIMPYPYDQIDIVNASQGPSAQHLLGTDAMGRDILSRLMYGGRYSLTIGVCTTLLATFFGVVLGAVAGYFGNMTDNILMRFMDIFQAIPGMLLAIVISAVLGPGFFNCILALAIGMCPPVVRMMRASILNIRGMDYVEAAASIDCSSFRIIVKYILPNSFSPVIVQATMSVAGAILQAAALSFIGLGVQPPFPEWGAMLSDARNYIQSAPHMALFPGIIIMITVLSINLIGDALRDALDPKLKN